MGIDFLDITIRIEKELGIAPHLKDLQACYAAHSPPDITVGELVEVLLRSERHCRNCNYDLCGHGGHAAEGVCPECGSPFGVLDETAVFNAVRNAVVAALRVKPEEIRSDVRLFRDLGVS